MRVRKDRVDHFARLSAVREGHELVDREVDRMEHDAATGNWHTRKKTPRRFMRPVQAHGLAIATHHGADKTAMFGDGVDLVTARSQLLEPPEATLDSRQ